MKQNFAHRPPTSGVHLLNDPDPEWLRDEPKPAPPAPVRLKKTRPVATPKRRRSSSRKH